MIVALSLALLAATPAPPPADAGPSQLVDAFIAAQRDFDQAALARLTDPGYVEVSPLGEVDPRERMLGFYAADKKQASPAVVVSDRSTRLYGNEAIVIARLSFGARSMRAVYVAHHGAAGWRLTSAQFTPIRTMPTPQNPAAPQSQPHP